MSHISLRRRALLSALSVAGLSACSDSTGSLRPAALAEDQGAVAEGTAGTVLVTPPTFTVKDQNGNALGGVSITVAVTAGGGTLTEAPTQSKGGPTPVGVWRLGNIAAVNTITVSVGNLTPLVINVNGKAGAPANIVFVSGANQAAPAGSVLAVSPVAQVRDQFGNAVAGVPVTFAVIDGEGSVASNAPITTDASGNAASPRWTLGKSAVIQSVRATTGTIAALVTASVASDYDIDLRFFGPPMPPATASMFQAAAARIKGAVTGDIADVAFLQPQNLEAGCGVAGLPVAFTDPIDDIVIFASFGPIDGPSRILGFSFPCGIRSNNQPAIGIMKFDSDDIDNMIAQGNLTDVIQHEMLHLVGVGTVWNRFGLLAGAGTQFSRYTGAFGIAGCVALGGAQICQTSIPVENNGVPGTADAHWRDAVFFNELMTGFVNTRVSVPIGILNPLSTMTIQSLADFGYTVNPNAADPFTIPGISAIRGSAQLNVDVPGTPWERIDKPRLEITTTGKVKQIVIQ